MVTKSALYPALLSTVLLAIGSAHAADEVFRTEAGAIRGYDPVAYFTDGKPVMGQPDIAYEWNGATWHFASVEHRALFAKDPAHYAPRYGGYCAYGTSQGYKVSTQPEAFAIVGDALYLNYNKPVQATWNKDTAGYIRTASGNWTTLEHEPYESDEATIASRKGK
jgi:YHS domain-containing protein